MPFTSCVSFALYASKRRPCPLRLIAALGIGFGNVPLTDLFDVLFARRIYFPMLERIRCSSGPCLQIRFISFIENRKLCCFFFAFYFVRYFILGKYDRLRANNVSVNNELDVSAMLVWLPQFERI